MTPSLRMALSTYIARFVGSVWAIAAVADAFHVEHRVSCDRQKLCNGNLMCAFVCRSGTADTDPWADSALAYQRKIQRNDPLVIAELPATHNSAISEAYGE